MASVPFTHFSKNGEILPLNQASISLFDINYSYGFGVYETIRVKAGYPLFLQDHLMRLLESARLINLVHLFTTQQLTQHTKSLLSRLSSPLTCNLKILLIGSKTKESATLYLLPLAPLFPDRKLYRDGVKVLPVTYERWLPNAKTLNMLPSHTYYAQAQSEGCYDALFIDRDGNIREGSRTNFFAMKGKEILSPSENQILTGVTRQHVLKVAKENGYTVTERPLPLAELKKFNSVFLTSTSSKILPIQWVGEIHLPPIPNELRELMKLFDIYLDEATSV